MPDIGGSTTTESVGLLGGEVFEGSVTIDTPGDQHQFVLFLRGLTPVSVAAFVSGSGLVNGWLSVALSGAPATIVKDVASFLLATTGKLAFGEGDAPSRVVVVTVENGAVSGPVTIRVRVHGSRI